MSVLDWRTLRAVGQGVVGGCVVSGAVGLAVLYFGAAGLAGAAMIAGPGLIALSYFMERRAKRAQKESE
jgi:hypothetical protein